MALSLAWFNRSTGVQSYGLKCNRALDYARQNAPEIHRRYQTTAAYLDVHTCVPPSHQLDHQADQPFAAMGRGKVVFDTELFQYMRNTHEGPLFGEGNNHMYWGGRCDGVEAQVRGGEDHAPFPDFDHLRMQPQMVNHGMGYYERWFRDGYEHRPGISSCAPFQIDKYRAQEVAYGHAGFVGNLATANVQWVAREHHLMHPLQRLSGTARVNRIEYEVTGQFVTASVALAVDRRERQRITYSTGLRVWVNWSAEPWQVEGRTLPQWGFLGLGPDTEVWSARTGAGMADYAMCPEFLFVDARTFFDMPYRKGDIDAEKVDFARNMNPPGTWIDFGSIATDGSVKVDRGTEQLVVYPTPPGRPFTVELDPGALGLAAAPTRIQALEALSDDVLQEIPFERRGQRIRFTVGQEGAGRYLVLP